MGDEDYWAADYRTYVRVNGGERYSLTPATSKLSKPSNTELKRQERARQREVLTAQRRERARQREVLAAQRALAAQMKKERREQKNRAHRHINAIPTAERVLVVLTDAQLRALLEVVPRISKDSPELQKAFVSLQAADVLRAYHARNLSKFEEKTIEEAIQDLTAVSAETETT